MSHLKMSILMILLALALAACSASEPQMIASFPADGENSPVPLNLPQPAQYVYNASLELDVSNLENASERAIDLAYQYEGYLVSSHAWQSGDTQHARLVLAVPVINFDKTFNALSRLGNVVNQHISGEWASQGHGDGWTVYSEITVLLNDADSTWARPIGGWRPVRTLSSAWDVFVAIFGFLADVIIWLIVVVGPFLILAYIVHRVVKRIRRNP